MFIKYAEKNYWCLWFFCFCSKIDQIWRAERWAWFLNNRAELFNLEAAAKKYLFWLEPNLKKYCCSDSGAKPWRITVGPVAELWSQVLVKSVQAIGKYLDFWPSFPIIVIVEGKIGLQRKIKLLRGHVFWFLRPQYNKIENLICSYCSELSTILNNIVQPESYGCRNTVANGRNLSL